MEFFHTLKAAPWEYAGLTFFAHLGIAMPSLAIHTLPFASPDLESEIKVWKEKALPVYDMYKDKMGVEIYNKVMSAAKQ